MKLDSHSNLSSFQICDMVAIARYLNVTLIVPELDKTSFWNDPRYVSILNVFDPLTGYNKVITIGYQIFLQE